MECFQHSVPRKEHNIRRQPALYDLRQLLLEPFLKAADCPGACKFTGLQSAYAIAHRQHCNRLSAKVGNACAKTVLIGRARGPFIRDMYQLQCHIKPLPPR